MLVYLPLATYPEIYARKFTIRIHRQSIQHLARVDYRRVEVTRWSPERVLRLCPTTEFTGQLSDSPLVPADYREAASNPPEKSAMPKAHRLSVAIDDFPSIHQDERPDRSEHSIWVEPFRLAGSGEAESGRGHEFTLNLVDTSTESVDLRSASRSLDFTVDDCSR